MYASDKIEQLEKQLELLQKSIDIWQSYYDQINMTDDDKKALDNIDIMYAELK